MSPAADGPRDLDELIALARRFAELQRYDEAGELFRLAQRLDPKNLGVQLALAQLKRQQKDLAPAAKSPRESAREEAKRNAIDAAHFLGLAHLYVERGEDFRALECLEIAQAKDSGHPGPWKLAGRIHLRLKDFDRSADLLARAHRLNPFDLGTAEQLGQVEYERRQFHAALVATIDAFLLLADAASAGNPFHWVTDVSPEEVEFVMKGLFEIGLVVEAEHEAGRLPLRPPAADEFHHMVVKQVLAEIEVEGPAFAQFVEGLRGEWGVAGSA